MNKNEKCFFSIIYCITITSCKVENSTLLVEAENFEEKGGWLTDPQVE